MSLTLHTVRGALWTIAASLGTRGIGLVSTLILTRFVSREDYGEAVAVAASYAFLAHRISSTGGGQYIVAHPDAPRRFAFHMTFFHLLLGAITLGGVVALIGPLAALSGTPNLGAYLPGLAAAAYIERIGYMPERVLVRDLRFRSLSAVRTAGELTFSVVTVGAAVLGWGALAYVLGNVCRAGVRTAMFIGMADRREWLEIGPLDMETTRTLYRYAVPMWLAGLFGQAAGKVDNILVSASFGPGVAGMYSLAYNLADIPASHIGEQVGEVLLPAVSRMKEAEARRRAFLGATTALFFVISPLSLGLALVAPELSAAFFKPEYALIGPLLTILASLSIARSIGGTTYAFLIARDNVRALALVEAAKLALIVLFIAAASRLDVRWAAAGVGVAYAAHAFGGLASLHRARDVPAFTLLRGLAGPSLACALMSAAVLGARAALPPWPAGLSLAVLVAIGAIAYGAGALIFARPAVREMSGVLRDAMRRRGEGEEPRPSSAPT
ncbi:MAG: oligosaccharide flippase family protein [Polyangiaceae bacterium]|nr:oligosaccharide flippase family protein [Polyangiaceae bacterium]